jgi:hypothetical protein
VWFPNANSSSLLAASWGGARDDVFIVGANGTILHYAR